MSIKIKNTRLFLILHQKYGHSAHRVSGLRYGKFSEKSFMVTFRTGFACSLWAGKSNSTVIT